VVLPVIRTCEKAARVKQFKNIIRLSIFIM